MGDGGIKLDAMGGGYGRGGYGSTDGGKETSFTKLISTSGSNDVMQVRTDKKNLVETF